MHNDAQYIFVEHQDNGAETSLEMKNSIITASAAPKTLFSKMQSSLKTHSPE